MRLDDNNPVKMLYMKYKEVEYKKDEVLLKGFVDELKKDGYKMPEARRH